MSLHFTAKRGDAARTLQGRNLVVPDAGGQSDQQRGQVYHASHIEVRAIGREAEGTFRLRIAVADTGPGILLEQQSEIFNLFTQRRSQDLARYSSARFWSGICWRLAALMAEGVEGERLSGARPVRLDRVSRALTLVLPSLTIADQGSTVEKTKTSIEGVSFALARILVANDNAPNRWLLVEYLSPPDGLRVDRS